MTKNLENIEIEVNELKDKSIPTWEVVIPNKRAIGLIEKVDNRYRATSQKKQQVLYSKTLESSINDLLAYFALHEK